MPTENLTIVMAPPCADDPIAGDQSYFRAHPLEINFVRAVSHAERVSAGQLPPGCQQVRVHWVGGAASAMHVREYLPPAQDWRFLVANSTPSAAHAKPVTRRFTVTNLLSGDPFALRELCRFVAALP